MSKGDKFKPTLNNFRALILILLLFWTGIIVASMVIDVNREADEIDDYSRVWAKLLFEKVGMIYRWSASNAGMYAPTGNNDSIYIAYNSPENNPPADFEYEYKPHFYPIHMTRQLLELKNDEDGVRWHITSLTPLNPENRPDLWEKAALKSFSEGAEEYSSIAEIEGRRYYRYMRPMTADKSCLGCHDDLDLKESGTFGGISISLPYSILLSQAREGNSEYILGHTILWVFGLCCALISYLLMSRRLKEKIQTEVELKNQAAFVMNSPSPIFRVDIRGKIIHINPAVLKLLNQDNIDEPISSIIPTLNKDRLDQIRKSEIDSLEQTIGDKIFLFVIRYDKSTLSFYIYGSDITELKATEDDLRNSKNLLALHIKQTPLAYIEWNNKLEVIEWNKAAENIFGFSKEEVIGKHAFESIVPGENVEVCTKIWQDLLKKSGGTFAEGTNLTKDGRIIYCNWYNTPLSDSEGNVVGLASLAQDFTKQREMEFSLRDNLNFLEILLETIPNPMFFKRHDGQYIKCNKAFAENILGLSKEKICGKTVYDFPDQIPRELADKYTNSDLILINNPGHQEYEAEVRCSDGKSRNFLFNKATYTGEDGEAYWYCRSHA